MPAMWVELERHPADPQTGKVDRQKSVARPGNNGYGKAKYAAPRNGTEQANWQRSGRSCSILEQVGIYDNFFELGGHSLLAMRTVSAIRKELNVELSVRDLFVYPVIASLGAYLDEQSKGTFTVPAITAGERPGQIPLSFSQERLWFIDKLEGSVQYHLPAVIRLLMGENKPA